MYIKFWDSVRSANPTLKIWPLKELFNPKNELFLPNGIKMKDYPKLLEGFFNRENLKSADSELLTMLFGSGMARHSLQQRLANKEILRQALLQVPEEDLVGLSHSTFGVSSANSFVMNYRRFVGTEPNDVFTTATSSYNWDHADVTLQHTSATVVDIREKFVSKICAIAKTQANNLRAQSYNLQHAEKELASLALYGTFLEHWGLFVRNDRIFIDNGANRFRPSDILAAGDPDSAVKVTIAIHQYGDHQLSLKYVMVASDKNRRPLYQVMSYGADVRQLIPVETLQEKNEYDPIFYGVELEVATDYNINKLIDAQKTLFMIGKQDSSISGSKPNRIELVTIPMTMKSHKRQWAHWFSQLDYAQFDTSKKTNNGMHVHIGRIHFLDQAHVNRLAWFYNNPANREILKDISEREDQSLNTYAPLVNWGQRTKKAEAIKNIIAYINDMRGALNTRSNKPTIEVRLFKGIVSYAAMVKNLEFVDATFHYTMDCSVMNLSMTHFVKWLNTTPTNKYPVLKKFLSTIKDIDAKLKMVPTTDLLFGVTNEAKIVEIINKKLPYIDNDIISVLNKQKGKRTFILDKKTGKVSLHVPLGSPVAHLDRELEARYSRSI